MGALDPLSTLTTWLEADPQQRVAVGRALANVSGFPEVDPVGRHAFRALRHPTGLHLVAVPGGIYWCGLTDADLYALFTHLDGTDEGRWDEIRAEVERATPQVARVAPFLCAAEQWGDGGPAGFQDEPWNHRFENIDAVLAEHSARLLDAAEWEWIAREGGKTPWVGVSPDSLPIAPRRIPRLGWGEPNGFGVGNLLISEVGELVHAGDGRALRGGHGTWQDDLEAIALLSGYDWPLNDERAVPFRLAFSVGMPAPEGEPPAITVPDDAVGRAVARFRDGATC